MTIFGADVVVVGGGAAGLAAAVAAAEGGAKVVVFEKANHTGGTGNMATGLFAVESELQLRKNIALTTDEAFKLFMEYTHWRVNARLVRAFIDKSADTIAWLERLGVEFNEPTTVFRGAHFTYHMVKALSGVPSGSDFGPAFAMMNVLAQRAREKGVVVYVSAAVKGILKNGDQVAGVIAENESGETTQVDARTVVIATGGFADNKEWIKKYTGFDEGRDVFLWTGRNLLGEGIRMAWEAGAAEEGMNVQLTYAMTPGPGGDPALRLLPFRQPYLILNQQGRRFVNEELVGNGTFMGNAIARQKYRCAYAIFDGQTKRRMEQLGVDRRRTGATAVRTLDDLDADIKKAQDEGYEHVFVADSLAELGEKIAIAPRVLQETIEEYNQFCATGRDRLFGKNPRFLLPVKEPKFYAGRLSPTGFGSLGGIKTNERMEALNSDHEAIPGLYAAGSDACTIFGDSYDYFMPGGTLGFAVNSGRVAAQNAVKYIGL